MYTVAVMEWTDLTLCGAVRLLQGHATWSKTVFGPNGYYNQGT